MLSRRALQSNDTMHRAIEGVGGLHVVPAAADPERVRREVLARGIHALEVQSRDLEVVRGLPLEFLIALDVDSVEPLATLEGLRGLHVQAWTGGLDFDALPRLEWFGATEIERGQLDPLLERDREELHHLSVGRYPYADATPLHPLAHLTHVAIGDSRAFTSPRSLGALTRLRHLSVYRCPKLESLAGVETASGLQHVDLQTCNRVTDLSPLARLEGLRSVQIETRNPPSLTPLIGHPTLEYLWIVSSKRPPPDVVDALLRSPRLRFLHAGRSAWLRPDGEWESIPDIYAMTGSQRATHERMTQERSDLAAW